MVPSTLASPPASIIVVDVKPSRNAITWRREIQITRAFLFIVNFDWMGIFRLLIPFRLFDVLPNVVTSWVEQVVHENVHISLQEVS